MGLSAGVRRLYVQRFGQGTTAKQDGPVHLALLDHGQEQPGVEVAPDGKPALARFHCLMQVSARDTSRYPMMDLARQQGQGILQWWEGGLYENSYVKVGEVWKIKTLDYRPQGQADYAPGGSHAMPDHIPPFSKTYPEDPAGPDKLIAAIRQTMGLPRVTPCGEA
jgi:hypothetical protein